MKPIDKVLIVDVNNEFLVFLESLLKKKIKQNISVKFAGSLKEARSVLREFDPDLVICEHALPDGKGPELFPELKNLKHPPFICHVCSEKMASAEGHVVVHKPTLERSLDGIILFAKHRM